MASICLSRWVRWIHPALVQDGVHLSQQMGPLDTSCHSAGWRPSVSADGSCLSAGWCPSVLADGSCLSAGWRPSVSADGSCLSAGWCPSVSADGSPGSQQQAGCILGTHLLRQMDTCLLLGSKRCPKNVLWVSGVSE